MSQAMVLNGWFCELSRRASNNLNAGIQYTDGAERFFKLAMKAQNQCRMTLETLAAVKNPPVVFARQANIANGPQQVNNTLHAPARETETLPSKLVEHSNETPMDTTTAGNPCNQDTRLEAMAEINGASHD